MTALVASTAACGSSSRGVATDPNIPQAGPVTGAHVSLVSMTGGGGRVSPRAALLDTDAHVRAFAAQFGPPAMRNRIRAAVGQARTRGQAVYGAVVALGCDRPPGAVVSLDGGGAVVITPRDVASPLPECLAAVTTVAIASVPGAD
ncbi:MAG TPA: hypothetical protein VHW64_09330 [Nocardioides sp.]|jgi:hypothetical protein|uniref:hypothetical protein n=1 Tax=Nocardioides sp. TaxID=35761 RepID=UPI002E31CBDD|nr:hypothetical protein [Nocardioides sp.]HEX3930894.1 hypothetical protein [Nocardioides sp.]